MFSSENFMPHGHCYLWQPPLVATMVLADGLIALSYIAISTALLRLVRRVQLPFSGIVLAFGLFIAACAGTHLMEILTLWRPHYWLSALIKGVTAAASVATTLYTVRLLPALERLARASRLAKAEGEQMQRDHHGLEDRLAERTMALSQAMGQREEFLSVASHELRTPITSLQLQLQLALRCLQRADPQLEKVLRLIRTAERQNERLARLVDELLDVAHIQEGGLKLQCEPMDLCGLLVDLRERLEIVLTAAGCRLQLDMPEAAPGSWDGHRLEQVFVNLIGNACKYAPGSTIRVHVRQAEGHTEVAIGDDGPGIAVDVQARIFERFERGVSSRNISGLGLGLYIVRHIVELHGGSVVLLPQAGGACFALRLPDLQPI